MLDTTFDSSPAFGIAVSAGPGADPVAEARHAEDLGFDAVTVHRDVLHGPLPSSEMWTLLTWLAAHTSRIRIGSNVLVLPHRHPALLAKMAETLDRLAGGRLILGLGAGAAMNDPAFAALGLERQPLAAFEESLDVLGGLWGTAPFSHAGAYFRTANAELRPRPERTIPVWLGAFGPRMLDLTGRRADGWLPTMFLLEPEAAFRALRRVREAASRAGRDPDRLTYGYNVGVLVEDGAAPARGSVTGSARQVAAGLADLVRGGFTFLNLSTSGDGFEQRERLAAEVLPAVRSMTG